MVLRWASEDARDQLVDNAHVLNSDSSGPDEGEDAMNEGDVSSMNSVKSTLRSSKVPRRASQDPYGGVDGNAVVPPDGRRQEEQLVPMMDEGNPLMGQPQ